MGRKGVTYDEVAKVGDAMVSEGIEPTTTGVRERLGVGSNSTIGPHLAKWRRNRAAAAAPNLQMTLPSDVSQAVMSFMIGQIDAHKVAFDADLAAERAACESSDLEVDQLSEENAAAQARIAQLEVDVAEGAGRLKQALQQGKDAYQALDSKLAGAERRASDAEKVAAVAEARVEAADRRAQEAVLREQEAHAELKARLATMG